MQSVLERLADTDEIGLLQLGQSNQLPNGDRDTEGYVAAPHLALSAAGQDLTILAIAPADEASHGGIGSQSIVSVAEEIAANYWINGELRLVAHDYGESTAICLRKGHAKVLGCKAGAVAAVTFDEDNDRVVWLSHGRAAGSQVTFETTDKLPGLSVGAVYYVTNPTEHTFQVVLEKAEPSAVLTLHGGAGTHTARARPYLTVEWLSAFLDVGSAAFPASFGVAITHVAHGLTTGSTIVFSGGSLPSEVTAGLEYFVAVLSDDSYAVGRPLGTPILFAGTGGSGTATPKTLANVAGYVHLHDRFKTYSNVHVVTPYQPIEPGDYPSGTPVVPGYTLATDVTSYADTGLVLPFTWNEGIDGHGAVGTCTVSGLVVTLSGGLTVEDAVFAGGFVRVGGAKGRVASNTASTVTVESWTPAAGPGAGTLPLHLHLPHWRSNPHHFTAGEGFLYPSNNMQPGGSSNEAAGVIYSRPRGRLTGSYTGRTIAAGSVSTAVSAEATGRLTTAASGDLTASIGGSGNLYLTRSSATRAPATGLLQFQDFVRVGQLVYLSGFGTTPSIDGLWRVVTMGQSGGSLGSEVQLVPYDTATPLPGAVSGTIPAGATVTRFVWTPTYLFGSLIEAAWRMATELGRRIVVAHLGSKGSSQFAASTNNPAAPQGQIGWWDDDTGYDWTPSNTNGLAARAKRLATFIAPRAVTASFGTAAKLKFLGVDVWQGEADAAFAASRAMAPRTIPTFANWLRTAITAAGLSPYPSGAKIPVHWALITTSPWVLWDADGEIRAAITRFAALDGGFAAAYDPDASPKLTLDPLHFNGVGEATNGAAVAELLVPLIRFAMSFAMGPGAVAIANQALALIGDNPNVTTLEPANNAAQARLAAQFLPRAIEAVLQAHAWSFAIQRFSPQVLTETVSTWTYSYAVPDDLLHVLLVLPSDAGDDLQIRAAATAYDPITRLPSGLTDPATQPFVIESDREGHRVLRTHQEDPVVAYISRNVDVRLWDPAAQQALVYYLAHLLAGATLKGKTGIQVGQSMLQAAMALIHQAAASNAQGSRDVRLTPSCDWLP